MPGGSRYNDNADVFGGRGKEGIDGVQKFGAHRVAFVWPVHCQRCNGAFGFNF